MKEQLRLQLIHHHTFLIHRIELGQNDAINLAYVVLRRVHNQRLVEVYQLVHSIVPRQGLAYENYQIRVVHCHYSR